MNSLRGHGLLVDGVPYEPNPESPCSEIRKQLENMHTWGSEWKQRAYAAEQELNRVREELYALAYSLGAPAVSAGFRSTHTEREER